ncbi:carboxypeptidase-like regulatory domain-containing protein [Algoriphagus sp. SE2]|uniref:carboxypeptidase-like regulatory domain-containing protein n=1 Tax=Algoriphagus sp. SE2 TaxID=3141536 RepID=UPI0031CCF81A
MNFIKRPKSVILNLFLVFFLFVLKPNVFAENILKGRVTEEETEIPVPFASVFLINTTLGITADKNGQFSLSIPDGQYDVIVRMLGYEPVTFTVNTNSLPAKGYKIQLLTSDQELEQVEVERERDPVWYKNFEKFKELFFGTSKNGRAVSIENEEDLILDSETVPNLLQAQARNILKLDNPNLGYELEFSLEEFRYDIENKTIYYKGYPFFIPYKDLSLSKEKKIEKNRDAAYQGSLQHFIHSLYQGNSIDEGFIIKRIIKIPNPEKPTKKQFEEARSIFRTIKSQIIRDSIQINVLSKADLEDEIEKVEEAELDPETLLIRNEDGRVLLKYKDQFQVTYTREPMAREYPRTIGTQNKKNQISKVTISVPDLEIFFSGTADDPFGLLVEGYMAWERVGDLMPWDYVPIKSSNQ